MKKRSIPILLILFSFASKAQILLENYQFQPVQEFLEHESSDSLFELLNWDDKFNLNTLQLIKGKEAYVRYYDSTYIVLQVSDSVSSSEEVPLCQNFIGDGGQAYISAYIVRFSYNNYKLLVVEHFTGYRFGENEDVTNIDRTEFMWLKPKDGKLVTVTFWETED